ncbi:MAG: ABC transporter ATP-binding protein [Myxococcota bacterium]|nr:ABC transporter ATP-binding protein [Myxococcota bacterium]
MRIELKEVKKRFGRSQALRGVSATIPAGRRLALIGPNGSGKSTLLRCVLGLMDCEGEVLLDGHSPYENRVQVARQLAYVPQVAPQFSASVQELLKLVSVTRQLDQERIVQVASRLGLELGPLADRPFRALSGGMKQKVLLAIAFAAQPKLLVLDEPTASLDARSRDRVFELFSEVPPEVTLVLCSHRLEELRQLADHVLALQDGVVEYDGPAHVLRASGRSAVEELLDSGEVAHGA